MRHTRCAGASFAMGAALLLASACSGGLSAAETTAVWPTQGWQTSTPEAQGMDPAALAGLVESGVGRSLDSLLVVRHGRIVLDAYYAPYTAELPHVVNSVTKAVIGTLAAIAQRDGVLDGSQRPMLSFFGERTIANHDARKAAITLDSLFNMTAGLDWQEPLGNSPPMSMIAMERSQDWVQFILDRPMVTSPGDSFNYNSGNPHLVSAILTKVTGMSTEDYAREKLFGPMGITAWKWRRDPQGIVTGGYGLALQPRDMAKFGYLYLRNGEWEGKSLVPRGWVDQVNHATVDIKLSFAPAVRYANFFWALPGRQIYWANGYHCQTVIVYPALDIVAVTTGRDNCPLNKLISAIPEAVRSATALPPDPAGTDLLASAIRAAAVEKPTEVGETSPMAAVVSGKTYNFSRNPSGIRSLSLNLIGAAPHYDLVFYNRNPSGPLETLSGAIGLDGLYRRGKPMVYGVPSVKGKWLARDIFEIERLTIGASNQPQTWTLRFDGDKLNVRGKNIVGTEFSVDSESGG